MRKLYHKVIYLYYRLINTPSLLVNNVKVGANLRLRGRLFIKRGSNSVGNSIIIGNNVSINSSIEANPIGGFCKTIFNVRKNGRIIICDNVGISNTAIVSDSNVFIDEYANIGAGTCIYDTDFHSINPNIRLNGDTDVKTKPIHIGKRVFVGAHSIIMKGVSIGDNSVIGAGSVVTKSIPADEIWAGNPIRFIKKLEL